MSYDMVDFITVISMRKLQTHLSAKNHAAKTTEYDKY